MTGQHLHPLDDVQLLLGVDEGLQEEGGGEPGRHESDVVCGPVSVFVEGGGEELDHLPHEVEVGVVEDVVVLDEVPVVLPYPLLQVRRETHYNRRDETLTMERDDLYLD